MANISPLTAEIDLSVWGTAAYFNGFQRIGFVTAATSVTGGQPNFARCQAVSWAATLYIHCRGLLPPDVILLGAKFTLCPSLAFSYTGSVTARHSSSSRQPNFVAWYRKCNYGTFSDGITYMWLGGHHVGHWPTFYFTSLYCG